MNKIQLIINTAKSYLGQQEIQPNLGFKDVVFNKKMYAVGFYRTASWCGFFIMLVLFEVFADQPVILAYLKKYCSASTHDMWQNFRASKEIITGQVPKLGAVAFWQEGDGTNGHVGLVIWVSEDNKHYITIEGNSNYDGSRNGYEVAQNTHTVGLPHSIKGLNLLGFGYMPD